MKRTAGVTLLAPISWGTTYVTVAALLPAGRPLLVGALRVLPAAIVLVAVTAARTGWRPRGAEWWRSAVLALFNFGLFFPLLAVAVYRLPGGVAAAAGGLQPLLVGGLTWVTAGRRPRRVEAAVAVVAAVGVALVVVRPGADVNPIGVLAAVGANVSFAAGVVLTKRFPAPTNRVAATGWQLLFAAIVLVPVALVVEGRPPALTPAIVAGSAYLGLVGTALAFTLWFRGIERLPVPAPPLLGLAAPITGAAIGWLARGETLTTVQLVGFALTIGAIAYGATAGASATTTAITRPSPHVPVLVFTRRRANTSTGTTVRRVRRGRAGATCGP
jgi:probable blue pigment (indigoidine) exporter